MAVRSVAVKRALFGRGRTPVASRNSNTSDDTCRPGTVHRDIIERQPRVRSVAVKRALFGRGMTQLPHPPAHPAGSNSNTSDNTRRPRATLHNDGDWFNDDVASGPMACSVSLDPVREDGLIAGTRSSGGCLQFAQCCLCCVNLSENGPASTAVAPAASEA